MIIKILWRFTKKCTSKTCYFFTIFATLPTSDLLRYIWYFKKIYFIFFIKITLNDEFEIPDDKINANKAQYNLGREGTKISALSSKELNKNEYLTGEDLEYKPEVVEQAKFKYFHWVRFLIKYWKG